MEHNNNEELNQLREFYEQYKNTESAYVQYVNLKKQLNDALQSIDNIIKENRSFGKWAIIIGVATIPFIINYMPPSRAIWHRHAHAGNGAERSARSAE